MLGLIKADEPRMDKNGVDLAIDTVSGPGDRYDETHFLLGGGASGFTGKSLAKDLESTYRPNETNPFPESGAIDVLYVEGPNEDTFELAKMATITYGSDHRAIYSEAPTFVMPPSSVITPNS